MLALLSLTTALVVQSEAPAALPALKLRGGMRCRVGQRDLIAHTHTVRLLLP